MRKEIFVEGEYYHVYNRGIDHRSIVENTVDADRFVKCLDLFNSVEPIESLYALSFEVQKQKSKKLVDLVAYCLNPNHFHLILKQIAKNGVSKFMHRMSGGYTWYFNHKYKRGGSLLQGPFKAKHIQDNDYLLHLSTYVNLNNEVHQLSGLGAKLVRSSWEEYIENKKGICFKKTILNQFKNQLDYKKFALENLEFMLSKREDYKELKKLFME